MVRPRKMRFIQDMPVASYYKPQGIPVRQLKEAILSLEGFEALRLADAENIPHEEAALMMEVSRPTFSRILTEARTVVAKMLANGMALRIEGGNFQVAGGNGMGNRNRGGGMGRGMGMGQGRGLGQGLGMGRGRMSGIISEGTEVLKEKTMKKIAVSSQGATLEDMVDPRFGRAKGFIIIDTETMEFEYLDNSNSGDMAQGAGIKTAETVVKQDVEMVLTGAVGPKASAALNAAEIPYMEGLGNMTVKEAVEKFKNQ